MLRSIFRLLEVLIRGGWGDWTWPPLEPCLKARAGKQNRQPVDPRNSGDANIRCNCMNLYIQPCRQRMSCRLNTKPKGLHFATRWQLTAKQGTGSLRLTVHQKLSCSFWGQEAIWNVWNSRRSRACGTDGGQGEKSSFEWRSFQIPLELSHSITSKFAFYLTK